ncbi:MAG: peptidoglycan DD-metalloendopeptidase family protein [Bacilli bacterium]|nr:peptidoglycan DD-metalloendopeptidase family protein [Bacilli bacterium]
MKKIIIILLTTMLTIVMFYFELKTSGANEQEPKTYYKVYLDGNLIGTINNKEKLEKYIDKQNESYKKQYNINTIYAPNGLDIKADVLYDNNVDKIEDIYDKIQDEKPFTIKGYQYTITSSYETNEGENETSSKDKIKIYVLDKKTFTDSIDTFIKTYAGDKAYESYKTNTQKEIETTGTIIDKVYIKNNITVKEVNIPVTDKIYTDVEELSSYLLFGENQQKTDYTVNEGDTIETIAFANKISTQEFLLSNPTFTSVNNLLFTGQKVKIGVTNPQIQVVVKQFTVEDVESAFTTEIKYDPERLKGDNTVEREGENGLNRVSRELEITNGIITTTVTKNIEELKPSIAKIMIYGDKIIPNVGTGNWVWPTAQGYTISSPYGYRVDPIDGSRSLHTGLDIAGTGTGSPVYASDNGTVIESKYDGGYGNCIVINHNNGYYTLYGHMSKLIANVGDTVAQGQVIGLVGATGRVTGPHLHFETWHGGAPFRGGTRFNPYELFR